MKVPVVRMTVFPRVADPARVIDPATARPPPCSRSTIACFEVEPGLGLQDPFHPQPVQLLVGLGAGGTHRRPLAAC